MKYERYFALLDTADLEGVQDYLTQHPKAVNALDELGTPALLHGMAAGSEELCRWLVERSLSKLNLRDARGAGALHYAAAWAEASLLRYLVETVGFDPLQSDLDGRTPYGIAHSSGNRAGEAYFASATGARWEELYQNPVLPGFRPDPSILRVGEDYYMVNSSFTWFPALPISHSRDLIHWEPVGHVLTEENAAQLTGLESGHGYWAPDISYHKGRFYVTATLRRNDGDPHPRAQIVTSSAGPAGPYDPPAVIEEDGIDPSLFTDVDGRRYMLLNRGARLLPLTEDARASAGSARLLWYGDTKRASEGPRLLHKDGWYYLLLAEGGTGLGHQVSVGRSRSLYGPYEVCPYNPVLHQYDEQAYLQKAGHGQLVQTPEGDWFMVYLCARPRDGFSPLGRETALDPVQWTADGWPIVNGRRGPSVLQKKPALPTFQASPGSLDPHAENTVWVSQRGPVDAVWENGGLILHGHPEDLSSIDSRAGLFVRQTELRCSWRQKLSVDLPQQGQSAGITAYYDEFSHCVFGAFHTEQGLRLELRVREGRRTETLYSRSLGIGQLKGLCLRMDAEDLTRRFFFTDGFGQWQQAGDIPRAEFLSDEGIGFGKRFTGSMMGVFAVGKGVSAHFELIS